MAGSRFQRTYWIDGAPGSPRIAVARRPIRSRRPPQRVGEVLTAEKLAYKRTDVRFEAGFAPRESHRLIGRRASRPIQADETIREDMLE